MRSVAAVDVTGGDLGGDDIVGADRQAGSVVRETHDPVEFAGVVAVEHHDLAAVLAVHAHVPRRLLDHAVGLARHDVAVVGEADVEPLSTAAEGEEQLRGRLGAGDADRHGPFELD